MCTGARTASLALQRLLTRMVAFSLVLRSRPNVSYRSICSPRIVDTWFRIIVKMTARDVSSSYKWHEMTFCLRWTCSRSAILCSGVPSSFSHFPSKLCHCSGYACRRVTHCPACVFDSSHTKQHSRWVTGRFSTGANLTGPFSSAVRVQRSARLSNVWASCTSTIAANPSSLNVNCSACPARCKDYRRPCLQTRMLY